MVGVEELTPLDLSPVQMEVEALTYQFPASLAQAVELEPLPPGIMQRYRLALVVLAEISVEVGQV